MVRAALWLETKAGLETLAIGREGCAPAHSCTLEMSGRHLFYSLLLDGGFLFLSAQPMDLGDCLERLVTVADGPEGWQTICRLVAALERSGLRSLTPKPIELGTPGMPDSWVIG